MRVPNPWAALRDDHPDVLLLRLPISERGRAYSGRRAVVLRRGLLLVEERSTLWHELVHLDRGDRPCATGDLESRQESACCREAARRAIPIGSLCRAAVWSDDVHEIADELKVTPELLLVRMTYLSLVERRQLRRPIAAKEAST